MRILTEICKRAACDTGFFVFLRLSLSSSACAFFYRKAFIATFISLELALSPLTK